MTDLFNAPGKHPATTLTEATITKKEALSFCYWFINLMQGEVNYASAKFDKLAQLFPEISSVTNQAKLICAGVTAPVADHKVAALKAALAVAEADQTAAREAILEAYLTN